MPDELLFTVTGSTAVPATPITLAQAGLQERGDLQEWVLAHPRLLGPGVRIVTFEFDRWSTAFGERPQDRLDVLGLDESGVLVVAELKRDRAPDTTEMQAIKYAAMCSRFSLETLASQHARFLTQRGSPTTDEEALGLLTAHAPSISPETLGRPRIVLLAADYPPVVTATTVWLTEIGLDIILMRFQAYRTANETVLTVSQLYPVPDVEEFTVAPRVAEARSAQESRTRAREANTVRRLVEAATLADGTLLNLRVHTDVNAEIRQAIETWVAEEPARGAAVWQNKVGGPLLWKADGQEYTPTGLVRLITRTAAAVDRPVHGPRWWVDAEGRDLYELATESATGKNQLYEQFWTRFIERQREEHPDWSRMRVAPPQNWITMPSPIRGTQLGANFAANGRLRSELYIDNGDADANLQLFRRLQERRSDIEHAYGESLTWEELPGRQACRVVDYGQGDVTLQDEWEKYIDWFFDTGSRLRAALASGASDLPRWGRVT